LRRDVRWLKHNRTALSWFELSVCFRARKKRKMHAWWLETENPAIFEESVYREEEYMLPVPWEIHVITIQSSN
jgi:hypothetical protein